jgi:hypothetical protein
MMQAPCVSGRRSGFAGARVASAPRAVAARAVRSKVCVTAEQRPILIGLAADSGCGSACPPRTRTCGTRGRRGNARRGGGGGAPASRLPVSSAAPNPNLTSFLFPAESTFMRRMTNLFGGSAKPPAGGKCVCGRLRYLSRWARKGTRLNMRKYVPHHALGFADPPLLWRLRGCAAPTPTRSSATRPQCFASTIITLTSA